MGCAPADPGAPTLPRLDPHGAPTLPRAATTVHCGESKTESVKEPAPRDSPAKASPPRAICGRGLGQRLHLPKPLPLLPSPECLLLPQAAQTPAPIPGPSAGQAVSVHPSSGHTWSWHCGLCPRHPAPLRVYQHSLSRGQDPASPHPPLSPGHPRPCPPQQPPVASQPPRGTGLCLGGTWGTDTPLPGRCSSSPIRGFPSPAEALPASPVTHP